MREMGVLQAKTQLSALLDEVERGEEIVITRHGKPVARMIGMGAAPKRPGPDIAERIREIRERAAARYPPVDFDALAALRAMRDGED